jgi:hypothetical protein
MKSSNCLQSRNGLVAKTRFSESYCAHPLRDDTFQNPQPVRVIAHSNSNNSKLAQNNS